MEVYGPGDEVLDVVGVEKVLALRDEFVSSGLDVLVEQDALRDLCTVVFVTALELVQQNEREEPLHPTIVEVVMDQIVVKDVNRQRNSHSPREVRQHPVIVHLDVRHLIIPLFIIWVQEERIHREHRGGFLRDLEQIHHFVDTLVPAITGSSENRHPGLLIPQA